MIRKTCDIRKQEIIESAMRLIFREGVRGVTIKNLAQENQISEGAIYRHFKDKQAILLGLVDMFEANLMEAIEKSIKADIDPLERLKEIMKTHMMVTQKKKGILFSITTESIYFNDDMLRRRILAVIEKYKNKIRSILMQARSEGLIRSGVNLDAVSLTFFGLIQAAIVQYALTNYTVAPITKFSTLWNVFLMGIKDKK
jgi:AcrR family transcriptional regulator